MSYAAINSMATNPDLQGRVFAAVLKQDVQVGNYRSSTDLFRLRPALTQYMYYFAAQPGWDTAWQYAIDNNIEGIGNNPAVITDGMILAAMELILPNLAQTELLGIGRNFRSETLK